MLDLKKVRRKKKRVGRGHGSGHGKTSGRGTGGQGARRGEGIKLYFEGGQFPLSRTLPKFGFTNVFRHDVCTFPLDVLNRLEDGELVNNKLLVERGILSHEKRFKRVKFLSGSTVRKNMTFEGISFSASAKKAIESSNV